MPIQNNHISANAQRHPNLGDAGKILQSNWQRIVVFAIAAGLSGLILCFFLPAKYAAKAVIMPAKNEQFSAGSAGLAVSPFAFLALQNKLDTGELYLDILQSDRVAEEVLQSLDKSGKRITGLPDDWRTINRRKAIAHLREMTIIDETPSGLISVEVIAGSPELSAVIANTYFAMLDSVLQQHNREKNAATRRFLQTRLAVNTRKLQQATDSLAYFQSRFKIIAPVEQATGTLAQLSALKEQILEKEIEIEMLEKDMQPNNPQLLFARENYAALKKQYEVLQSSQEKSGDVFTSFKSLPAVLARLASLEREVKMYEHVWRYLNEQLQRSKFREQQNMPVIYFLSRAVPDENPVWPKPMLIVPVLIFVVMLCSIIILLYREFTLLTAAASYHSARNENPDSKSAQHDSMQGRPASTVPDVTKVD